MKTGSINYLVFGENKMIYLQDHFKRQGIPKDVRFFPLNEVEGTIAFAGDGYGWLDYLGFNGKYGDGSIYVFTKDLPEDIVTWCRANFIKEQ